MSIPLSPYNPQTTAYLQSTYPAYWNDIKEYGYSHPAYVPYIEEDNDLIVSLVFVGYNRTLNGDGNAYINTGYVPTIGTPFSIIYHSSLVRYSVRQMEGFSANGSAYWGIGANAHDFGLNAQGGVVFIEGAMSEISITYSGAGNLSLSLNGANAGSPVLYINAFHAYHINGWNGQCMLDHRKDLVIIHDDSVVREMYPFIRNGQNGMIDIRSGVFYSNAGSGAFALTNTPI